MTTDTQGAVRVRDSPLPVSNSAKSLKKPRRKGSNDLGIQMTPFECWKSSNAEYMKNKQKNTSKREGL